MAERNRRDISPRGRRTNDTHSKSDRREFLAPRSSEKMARECLEIVKERLKLRPYEREVAVPIRPRNVDADIAAILPQLERLAPEYGATFKYYVRHFAHFERITPSSS